jgi:hypothetical protein
VDKTFYFLIRRRLYYGKSCSYQRNFLHYPPRNVSMTRHTNQHYSLKSQNGLNACAFEFLAIQRSCTGHGGHKKWICSIEMIRAEAETPPVTIPSHAWQFASVMPYPNLGFLLKTESIDSIFRTNPGLGYDMALANCHMCELIFACHVSASAPFISIRFIQFS